MGKYLVSETFQEEPFVHAYRQNFPLLHLINSKKALVSQPGDSIASLDEAAIHPMIGGQFNYYTWMIEILPRIALTEHIEEFRALPYVFSGPMSRWQQETLKLIGIPPARVLSLEGLAPFYFDRAFVPITSLYEIPNIRSLQRVREILGRQAGRRENVTSGRRMYVSRGRQGHHRSVVNEGEIRDWLAQRGFEVMYPEQLSVAEQIQAFSDAEVIAGPTGAWASNLIFANSGAKILVFNPLDHVGLFFQLFASISGAQFCSVIGTTLPSMFNDRPHWNYVVPLQNIKAAMSYLAVD